MSTENKPELPDFGTPVSSDDFDKYPVASTITSAKVKTCEQYEALFSLAALAPALHQINQEHAIRPEDIAFITDSNCFIAPDRVELISRGLYYGFLGDLQLALHLLIPQFENSLRLVLHQRGAVASTMDSEGIQDERNINTLLPKHPALRTIFGKSLLWDFWALLVAEWGGNIRNHIAHGMTPDGGFYGAESIYAWSLLLRFYCLPLRRRKEQKIHD